MLWCYWGVEEWLGVRFWVECAGIAALIVEWL